MPTESARPTTAPAERPGSPVVSILLPAFRATATLPACLASLERQTLADWECVAVDDGSDDETGSWLARAARADRRFQVVRTPHRGLVAALNTGLAACRGAFVARMDADDVMHRDRIGAQVSLLEADPTLSAIGCHVRMFPRRGLTPHRREYEAWLNGLHGPDDIARDALVECPVAHPTLMIRREVLAVLRYRDVPWPEDYDLILRLLAGGHRVGTVARRLVCWRDSPGRLSRTDPRYGLDRFVACKARFLAEGFLAGSTRYVLWGYGATGRALRRALLGFGREPELIVEVKPSRLGKRIHGAPVVAPADLAAVRGVPVVVSVARAGPRADVRAALRAMGFVERRDFVCTA